MSKDKSKVNIEESSVSEDVAMDSYEEPKGKLAPQGAAPLEINAGGKLVSIEVKVPRGQFCYAGTWYDLPKGVHKVSPELRDILKIRGDLG